jgi:hypothetical protein
MRRRRRPARRAMTRSASLTASARVTFRCRDRPSFECARALAHAEASGRDTIAGEASRRMRACDRRADQADADQRDAWKTAARSAAVVCPRRRDMNSRQLRPPRGGSPPRCRPSCAARPAGRRPATARIRCRADVRKASRRRRVLPGVLGKWIRMKLPTLGVTTSQAQRHRPLRQPAAATSSLCAAAPARCGRVSLQRRRGGGDRRRGDVERPANAVQRVDRRAPGPVGPADAQRGEAVDLREGAAHHTCSRWWRRVRCRPRSRCGARIRHRRRRAPAARSAAGCVAGASPRRTAGRCRSGCSGWRGTRSWCARVTAASGSRRRRRT